MIKYIPNIDSTLWARKSMEYFDTIEDLKSFIADQRTRFYHFIGQPERFYKPHEVELIAQHGNNTMFWKNYCSVVLDGRIVGFCGE